MTTASTALRPAAPPIPADGPDLPAARRAVADLLAALGHDCADPHTADTPRRVAEYLADALRPEPFTLTTFPAEPGYDGLVVVRDIGFSSLCAHHLLPFRGVAHVAYLPGARVMGLSKAARTVRHYARDLQTQERLTVQVADRLETELGALGVGVRIVAEHMCMSVRGVRTPEARTTTTILRGALQTDPDLRREFLDEHH